MSARFDYFSMMRDVVVRTLADIAENGLDDREVLLVVQPRYPGVDLPAHVLQEAGNMIGLILRPGQFRNLTVSPDEIKIVLAFNGFPCQVTIPIKAIAKFTDAVGKFSMDFPVEPIEDVAPRIIAPGTIPFRNPFGRPR